MNPEIETERETDGRWIAEIAVIPGVMAYGDTRDQAISNVQSLYRRVLTDKRNHGELHADNYNR